MGPHSYVSVADKLFHSVHKDYDINVMSLFTEEDKRVRSYSHQVESDQHYDWLYEEMEHDPFAIIEYVVSLAAARDRLEFMGFTLSTARREFDEGIEDLKSMMVDRRSDPKWMNNDRLRSLLEKEEQALELMTFELWMEHCAYIVEKGLVPNHRFWADENDTSEELPITLRYMLNGFGSFLGFPTDDFRVFLRVALEITGIEGFLTYDLTELVAFDYFPADEDFSSYSRILLIENVIASQKVIVLTEGSTDKWVLETSLRLLYPHLVSYYSFMDFVTSRAQGGAPTLVATLKAFIGAGIANRIVALFDNDTAAQVAMRQLRDLEIPRNVRVLRYPDISIATNYPTLGPQGIAVMNINGLAGSIELYFGRDVLATEEGDLTPIQWRGYDESLHQYQGEVTDKKGLQARFEKKLRACEANPESIATYDWSDVRSILDELRRAFLE